MRKICLVIASMVFLLAGCSLAGFAYDLAPRIAVRYADGYLELNNRQEARALELFRARHALHARDELPRYYAFLTKAREFTADGLDRDEIDQILDQARALYQLAVERTLPAVAEILVSLEPAQLALLEKRLVRNIEKDREKMRESDQARRTREALEDTEEWVGAITEEQQRRIENGLREMHETRPLWLQWRVANAERFITFMREEPSRVEVEQFLAAYWLDRKDMPEELAERLTDNMERYREMLVDLDQSLSPEQRRHARDRLAKFSKMVIDVMPDDVRRAVMQHERDAGELKQLTR